MRFKIQSFESVIFGATISDTLVKRIMNFHFTRTARTRTVRDRPDIYLQNINNNDGSSCWNDLKSMYTL